MIVSHTDAVETLLGVAAVAGIFAVKKFLQTREDAEKIGDRSEEIEVSESGGAGQTEIVPPAAEHISSYLLTSI